MLEFIKQIDVGDLVKSLQSRKALFDQITIRQSFEGTAHKDSKTIFIRGPEYPSLERWFLDVPHIYYQTWPELNQVLSHIGDLDKLGKVIIVALAPKGVVQWHVDEGAYADKHDRFHLPLVTNSKAFLYSGAMAAQAQVGQLLKFNNHILHSALNFGETKRIHLIVDKSHEV